VTGNFTDLTNRKTFSHPKFKPGLFLLPGDIRPLPGKCFMTGIAVVAGREFFFPFLHGLPAPHTPLHKRAFL
jgi:hypothetical protein